MTVHVYALCAPARLILRSRRTLAPATFRHAPRSWAGDGPEIARLEESTTDCRVTFTATGRAPRN
jgi:hypothetical protein